MGKSDIGFTLTIAALCGLLVIAAHPSLEYVQSRALAYVYLSAMAINIVVAVLHVLDEVTDGY